MPLDLTGFGCMPDTWARLINDSENRREAAPSYTESVGGELHGLW